MSFPYNDAKFIWLNDRLYPQVQRSNQTTMKDADKYTFCVAQFRKTIQVKPNAVQAKLYIFADTVYRAYMNSQCLGMGPVCAGGDFSITQALPACYYNCHDVNVCAGENDLFIEVQLTPGVLTQTSKGHGGLIASLEITYSDGTVQTVHTDDTWLCRRDTSAEALDSFCFDNRPDDWSAACETDNFWPILNPSPIPALTEEWTPPTEITVPELYKNRVEIDGNSIKIKYGCPVTFDVVFDKIRGGYPCFTNQGKHTDITFDCQEFIGQVSANPATCAHVQSEHAFVFRGWRMQSIGTIRFTVVFCHKEDVFLTDIGMIYTHYSENALEGSFSCSDEKLNQIYNLCKHTLKICRQSLHLDSPYHQENLACTGDYFIESLMAYYTLGDTKLSGFDIRRTVDLLNVNDGFMFHTTYSLILTEMITDYYKYSGDSSIFAYAIPAIHKLLRLFDSYTDSNGLITSPPTYMFVDHLCVDGFEMHHPPRQLGETVLNAFYYNALLQSARICRFAGDGMEQTYFNRAQTVKESFNRIFWDDAEQLYCDGRTDKSLPNVSRLASEFFDTHWLPEGTDKIYHTKYSNTLAVLYGLAPADKAPAIMEKVINDPDMIGVQPYFMHFVLEALEKTGLFEKYGINEIRKWYALVEECPRGLKEIWYGFSCDYSHAWGGTPAYQLPHKLSGLEMIEPGFKKIRLSPKLFDLTYADISVPTPFGAIEIHMKKGCKPEISAPKEITVVS